MREVDTDALVGVAPSLGIGNPAEATRAVLFDDEQLQQVIDVGGLVGRRQPADGLYFATQENQHAAANAVIDSDDYDFYSLFPGVADGSACTGGGTTEKSGIYPEPVPENSDVWLLGVECRLTSGAAANFLSAFVQLIYPPELRAFACTGDALGTTEFFALAAWDGIASVTNQELGTEIGSGRVGLVSIGKRIPRGGLVRFSSENQNATAIDVQFRMILGLFRSGFLPDFAL